MFFVHNYPETCELIPKLSVITSLYCKKLNKCGQLSSGAKKMVGGHLLVRENSVVPELKP